MSTATEAVLRLLKVPPRPAPPSGAPGSLRVFRASPRYLYLVLVRWAATQAGALATLLVGLTFVREGPFTIPDAIHLLEVLGAIGFVLQLPFTFVIALLDYRVRWYLVTDRSLRIREGVTVVREQTMSFSNIQNLEIRQGPLQRLLGIRDLEVRSAGGGGAAGSEGSGKRDLHLAYFRGVDNAEEIRDVVLERLRRLRDTGLGDLEETPAPRRPAAGRAHPDALAAAAAVLAEARALRRSLADPSSSGF